MKRAKALLLCGLAITSLHGQTSTPPPTITPYGAWILCDNMNPWPWWAQQVCSTLSPTAPKPWMLSVFARSSKTVAFSYQIQFTDANGKPQTAIGAFLRQDIGDTGETIFLPIPGVNGSIQIGTVTTQDLTTLDQETSNQ